MKDNEYVRLGGILLAITAAVALLLGLFNNMTADIIAATNAQKQLDAMQGVMPLATGFQELEIELPEECNIDAVFAASDDKGAPVGWCFKMTPRGYGGEITMMVGVDRDLAITGVDIVSHSETPGLGANADDDDWLSQFAGKTAGLTVVKGTAEGNRIEAVTSATITSNAVTGAVDEALAFAESLLEKEGE